MDNKMKLDDETKRSNSHNNNIITDEGSVSAFSDQISPSYPSQSGLFDENTYYYSSNNLDFLDTIFTYSAAVQPPPSSSNTTSTVFDLLQTPPPPPVSAPSPGSTSLPESSEVVNTPTTPNSSSLSSSSNDHHQQKATKTEQHELDHQDKATQKQLKAKKKEKKKKEARFAFMTKSEVDHLDDGYRWRKYGQKAVKNSQFPRSYYRCTTPSCGVKKRVERWCEDPSVVVTTYEGTHIHPCPVKHTGHFGTLLGAGSCFSTNVTSSQLHHYPPLHQNQHFISYLPNDHSATTTKSPPLNLSRGAVANSVPSLLSTDSSLMIQDQGLLQDMMVPYELVKLDTPKIESVENAE